MGNHFDYLKITEDLHPKGIVKNGCSINDNIFSWVKENFQYNQSSLKNKYIYSALVHTQKL